MTTVIMRNPIKPPDEPTAIIPQPDVPEPVIKNTFFSRMLTRSASAS